MGISSLFVPTFVSGTRFEQLSTGNYPSFNYGNFRTRQVGLQGQKLKQITDNTFEGLHVGIAHVLRDGDTDTRVLGNLFSACEKGYAFLPVSSTAAPTQPTGTAYLSCNSFRRGMGVGTRSGVSYGIYNEDRANVRVANPVSGGDLTLKNLFDDAGAGAAGFYAVYNANSTFQLLYTSYNNYNTLYSGLLSAGVNYVNSGRDSRNDPVCQNEGYPDNGIQQRTTTQAPTPLTIQPQLTQNNPNPADDHTTFEYQLPPKSQKAVLLIRRGNDGQLLQQLPLSLSAARCELDLRAWKPGIYFCTLVTDDVPGPTRQLLIR